jgi:hypothetical protein
MHSSFQFLIHLLATRLTLLKLSPFVSFGTCEHFNVARFLRSHNFVHPRQTVVYAYSVHNCSPDETIKMECMNVQWLCNLTQHRGGEASSNCVVSKTDMERCKQCSLREHFSREFGLEP